MEVDANVLSTFDLNSANIPAFSFSSFSVSSEKTLELRKLTDNQMSDNGGERGPAIAPAAAFTRCTTSSISAMKLQKVYRGYRTRRMLADSAVVAEELWWQALDFARLNHSTVSFFDVSKPETTASRWNRVKLNASKVGKGLSKDAKAQKLAFQHWIEAIDPRHRYGHSLHLYYEEWCKASAGQPFFYWLDIGDGKEVDLKECPRSKLRQQCIKYLGPKERQHYEYHVVDGKIMHILTGEPLDTNKESPGSKWIFVMSTSKRLYSGEKKKGLFHHSSFLAGGATLSAGRLIADDGVLKCISAYSGHYKPTDDCLDTFLTFLNENGVNLDKVEIRKAKDDYDNNGENGEFTVEVTSGVMLNSDSIPCDQLLPTDHQGGEEAKKIEYKRTLLGGLQSPKADIPRTSIMQRIETKKVTKSDELGHPLSYRWSTGAGPRTGCIADYPVELRLQALELMNLSLRKGINASALVSISSSPGNVGSNDLEGLNRP